MPLPDPSPQRRATPDHSERTFCRLIEEITLSHAFSNKAPFYSKRPLSLHREGAWGFRMHRNATALVIFYFSGVKFLGSPAPNRVGGSVKVTHGWAATSLDSEAPML
jgi:hypothetical protein